MATKTSDIATHLSRALSVTLGGPYLGHLINVLKDTDQKAMDADKGHGYHIQITDPHNRMKLFPVVTSSAYEAPPRQSSKRDPKEKSRYLLKCKINLLKLNISALVDEALKHHDSSWKKEKKYYEDARNKLQREGDKITSATTCKFGIRSPTKGMSHGQRQIEIGSSDDDYWFKLLRHCLPTDSSLAFFHRGGAEYDVVGWTNRLNIKLPAADRFWIDSKNSTVSSESIVDKNLETFKGNVPLNQILYGPVYKERVSLS